MSFSSLPLSYCTNVHPAQTISEVIHGLNTFTAPASYALGERIAAGLWLPASAIEEVQANPGCLNDLKETLAEANLVCYTLNTFPYGNFHSERVKENVYLPDWSTISRFDYTLACAKVLAELMPTGVEGSLSTVPLGFKGFEHPADFQKQCIDNLLRLAVALDELHDETGQVIRLAIEPEPLCVLETTLESINFFKDLFSQAKTNQQLEIAQRHLGLCYDVCHQSVEFEDVAQSISDITVAGIRINKIHITCAIQIDNPSENAAALAELARYVEQRYLHQTFIKLADGNVVHVTDLTQELCKTPPEEYRTAQAWRVHFHVPVHKEAVGALGTTRDDLKQALSAVAKLDYAPHLEVETYTWGVLPEGEEQPTLVQGLTQELKATLRLLNSTT